VADGRVGHAGNSSHFDYDVIVVGSGFGGSVAALRLCEKGYRVGVLEAGRRFDAINLPRSSWDVRRFVWAPGLGCFGIQRVHFLRDVVVLAGAGVGGGSLNYANTLYEPPTAFYEDPQWAGITDWRVELAPYYDQAKRMLGVTDNPCLTPADEAMLEVASEMGVRATFRPAPVGVLFGPPGTAPGTALRDPYFGGAGPQRRTCVQCGECMTGCRRGAKNTLLTNYLYLAERAGATVVPLTTARSLQPQAGGGWRVVTEPTGWTGRRWVKGRPTPRVFTAEQVVLAAGAYGTQRLLHSMVLAGKLPALSSRLGHLTRTNSESLLGAVIPHGAAFADRGQPRRGQPGRGQPPRGRPGRGQPDFSRGVAITSSFCPEPGTQVEPVRYGHRSNMMGVFGTVLVDGPPGREGDRPGGWRLARSAGARPATLLRMLDLRRWSERSVIALVMQARDNSLTVFAKRGLFGRTKLTSHRGHGEPNPRWSPVGHDVARRLAARIGGHPSGTWGEIFGVPMTAHFLGGCAIGASAAEGVIDPWQRVFGYEGLHIVDGSAMPANPGVNPSLTITALAERVFSYWPNRGEADPRPPAGAFCSPLPPVALVVPRSPVVPDGAPGELRLERPSAPPPPC
jgi:cholesterol oxidase